MKMLCGVLIAACVCSGQFAAAQSLTDDQVASAIQAGTANRFNDLVARCSASPGFGQSLSSTLAGGIQPIGSYSIVVSSNAGRIAALAADAKRLYRPFSAADVPEDLRAPMVFVAVEPETPRRSNDTYQVPAVIDRIVLKSKDKSQTVLQPETFETEPVEWKNLMGGTVEGNRAIATFSLDDLRELPPGEFDVIVITQAGERKCDVNTRNRARLFGK